MTDAYKQIIGELEQRLKQAKKLNVRHQAQIKDLKASVTGLEEENAHLAHELETEQSRNQEADDEEQRQGQKCLGREHDNAKGVL